MVDPRDAPHVGRAIGSWLTIVGIGENGRAGLTPEGLAALSAAEIIFGGPRHLVLADAGVRGRCWPVPFSVAPVIACRGRKVVVLASGDPFWFGGGSRLAAELDVGEWRALPGLSTFSLAAAELGWPLEHVLCLGLHAAPFETLVRHLAPRRRLICLMRDGEAVGALAGWLVGRGFGGSRIFVMEALGGPRARIREIAAKDYDLTDVGTPVAIAIEAAGGAGLSQASGLPDMAFSHDGQLTKRLVRALTLSALAPSPGALLWDIGAGSGSISVEWFLAGGRAVAIEMRADRVSHIHTNVASFGGGRSIDVVEGKAPAALDGLASPDAVFIGGGADRELVEHLWSRVPAGTRLVANAVTLETEAVLGDAQRLHGGELLRIEIAQAEPLGSMRGWKPSRPVVQWSAVR